MEYVYAALHLHKAGKEIDESSVQAVLSAAGIAVNESRVKALVASLDGVDIEDAISKAAAAPVAVQLHLLQVEQPLQPVQKRKPLLKKTRRLKKRAEWQALVPCSAKSLFFL